jgi:hypothetical protein
MGELPWLCEGSHEIYNNRFVTAFRIMNGFKAVPDPKHVT